jgi:hypothetical protein
MRRLTYHHRFTEAIEAGLLDVEGTPRPPHLLKVRPKFQTVRTARPDYKEHHPGRRPTVCERIRHYEAPSIEGVTGRCLGESICTFVASIQIDGIRGEVRVANQLLSRHAFARDEGFRGGTEMLEFIAALYGRRFEGILIGWRP